MYRLKQKWLWFSHSFKFRWAHTPLCNRFVKGAFRIGSKSDPFMFVCRSCTWAYLGIAVGLVFFLSDRGVLEEFWYFFVLSGSLTLVMSHPSIYSRWYRSVKDFLRFNLGLIISAVVVSTVTVNFLLGVGFGVGLYALRFIYSKRRNVMKSQACNGCEELPLEKICSGFTFSAKQIRSYEDQATQLYISSGQSPFS